ncbi:MAG: outer membrane protein TolC [Planctomycetota bacterium]
MCSTALLIASLSGCKSAAEFRAEADVEAYGLIAARRAALFDEEGGFSIDPPEGSVRQRIVSGEWDASIPLTLVDLLEIAAENSHDVRSNREGLYRAALDLTLEQWRNGVQQDAGGSASLTDSGSSESASASVSTGFSKVLDTGASVLAEVGSGLFRIVSTGDGVDLVTDLHLRITQPLLAGFGPSVTREALTQSERNLIYEVRDYERFRRTFAVNVARQMYSVLRAADTVTNEENNLENLILLTVRNRALADAGRLKDQEVDQAKQNELRSENRLLQLSGNLERNMDELKLFLGLPIDIEITLDKSELDRLGAEDPWLGDEPVAELVACQVALQERLEFQTVRDSLEDRERGIVVFEDALRAGLDLTLDGRAGSDDGSPLDYRGSNAPWSLSLGLDLPVDRVSERNAYRRELIAVENARRTLEREEDSIRLAVRDSLRQVRNVAKSYTIQQGAEVLANRRVESTQLMMAAGRASTRDQLEAQDALLEARNATTAALVDLTLTRLDFYLDLELLRVDERGMFIDEDVASLLRQPAEVEELGEVQP